MSVGQMSLRTSDDLPDRPTWRLLFVLVRDVIEFRVRRQLGLTIPITFLQSSQLEVNVLEVALSGLIEKKRGNSVSEEKSKNYELLRVLTLRSRKFFYP